jgi:hypothetical protein
MSKKKFNHHSHSNFNRNNQSKSFMNLEKNNKQFNKSLKYPHKFQKPLFSLKLNPKSLL